MTTNPQANPLPASPPPGGGEEKLLIRGVLGSWIVQVVFIATGFILPRLIDDKLGAERLGLWDFGWTFVAYLSLLQAGMNSSIARFVARYSGLKQWDQLSGFLRTALAALCICSLLAGLITLGAVALLPSLLGDKVGPHMGEARGIVLFLGLAVCIQFPQSVFGGVIAGKRRYDLLNTILAAGHLLQVTGVIVAVLLGFDLGVAAFTVMLGDVAMGVAKWLFAYRLCPEIAITRARVARHHLKDVLVFGGKTQLSSLSKLAAYQTSSLLVLGYLGPAALAIYARPRSLVMHAQKILRRLAIVMEPSAANFQAQENNEKLARLYVEGTRFAAYLAVPLIVTLAVLGGPLLRLWMGPDYARPLLIAVLAIGHLPVLVQRVTFSVLLGLGHHGRVALLDLIAGVISIGLTVLLLGPLNGGVVEAAIALVAPAFVVNLLYIPRLGCKLIGVPLGHYVRRAAAGPLLVALPYTAWLLLACWWMGDRYGAALLLGVGGGGVGLGIWYWLHVLPASMKDKVGGMIQRLRRSRQATVGG